MTRTAVPAWPEYPPHAHYLRDIHVPEPVRRWGFRWLGGVVPVPRRRRLVCRTCLQRWPCVMARWARRPRQGGAS